MADWVVILLVFVVAAAVITLAAVLANQHVKASVKLPGKAEFYIDTERGGWRKSHGGRPEVNSGYRSPHSPRSASKAKPRFYLEIKLRRSANWLYSLEGKSQVYVGRRDDNDIRLQDSTADTRQAVIYWQGDRYKINNLSSRVPTRVNGRPITKQNLGDGNTIQMGRTKLIFRDKSKHI